MRRALQRDDAAGTAATLAALLNLQGKPDDAGRVARTALASVDDDVPTRVRLQLLTEQARSQWDLVEHANARRTLDQALALAERDGDMPAQAELRTLRGEWDLRQARFADADTDLQAAIRLARERAPLVAYAARYVVAQNLMAQGSMEEGHAAVAALLADYRRLLGDTHPLVGRAWRTLAHADCALARFDRCLAAVEHADDIVRLHYGKQHPEYAEVLRVRSLPAFFQPGSRVDGLALLRRADEILRGAYPPDHPDVQRVESMLAIRLLDMPSPTPAARRQQLEDVIGRLDATLVQSRKTNLPVPTMHRTTLARALMERNATGDLARARRLLDENTVLLRAYTPTFAWRFLNQLLDARLALRTGDLDRADARLSDLLATLPRQQTSDIFRQLLRQTLVLRATLALRHGDPTQARTWLQKALAHAQAAFGPAHASTVQMRDLLATFDRTGTIPPED